MRKQSQRRSAGAGRYEVKVRAAWFFYFLACLLYYKPLIAICWGASMMLQSHGTHAALAEIRDSLLETYAANDAMNQVILAELDPRAWRAEPPGKPGSGRTIASIFAHLHNCRLNWLKNSAPHIKCPAPLDPDRCTMKHAAAAHR